MNQIKFELAVLEGKETVEYENIIYSECAFIKLHVDGVDLMKLTEERKGVVVWDELKKTLSSSGDYLILTCMCGVADDAGYNLVMVQRNDRSVSWTFNDNFGITWIFDKSLYDMEVIRLGLEIIELTVPLEPTMFCSQNNKMNSV
jgi:hypothetical protein